MGDCDVKCVGSLKADDLSLVLKSCLHSAVQIADCHVDADGLAPLRAESYPNVRLTLSNVTGTLALKGAELHDLMVTGSTLDAIDLHDATVDRVRIAPSNDSVPDAYAADTIPPTLFAVGSIDARSSHTRTFALIASAVGDVNLKHARVDETLDLSWTQARSISMRAANVQLLEAARLVTLGPLDLLGARFSQATLSRAVLASVDAHTASVDRVMSLDHAQILGDLNGQWLTAGAVVFNGTSVGSMDLSYSHIGLVDIDSKLASVPIMATGLHVDAISGDAEALTARMAGADGTFHSIETALRNGGRYSDANTIAFQGSWFTAGIAGKLPGELAVAVSGSFVLFFFVAAWCCKPIARDAQRTWKILLCAFDIVLPSFVDIGALSAWTDYSDAYRKDAEVKIEGRRRTLAFIMRILGTAAFTYLLLYVTTLRG